VTTFRALRSSAEARLAAAGVDTPDTDVRILLQHALGLDAAGYRLKRSDDVLTAAELSRIEALLARRETREPVWRILGQRGFWTLDLALSPATLEPRPDTETIVEATLAALPDRNAPLSILDLGTGTGCILLALLSELPNARGLGVDRAEGAVATASANAVANGLGERARFRLGDWGDGLDGGFDVVVSNPPYIPSGEIADLAPEVRDHDPAAALDGGADGLDAYRQIAPQLPKLLVPGGIAALEVGVGQAQAVSTLVEAAGLRLTGVIRDLASVERCVRAEKHAE
jgi:release factor glutamine methyltransferase